MECRLGSVFRLIIMISEPMRMRPRDCRQAGTDI